MFAVATACPVPVDRLHPTPGLGRSCSVPAVLPGLLPGLPLQRLVGERLSHRTGTTPTQVRIPTMNFAFNAA